MTILTLEEAWLQLENQVHSLGSEVVLLDDALDRICNVEIKSPCDIPLFDKSAMDGFAIRSDDWAAQVSEYRVIATTVAGDGPARLLNRGEAARIMTGAPLPLGAEMVVVRERSEALPRSGDFCERVRLDIQGLSAGSNIVRAASCVRQESVVLEPGSRIGAARIGLLAELGFAEVQVRQRPRVAVLATGNELRAAGEALCPGEIRNSNGPMLMALFRQTQQCQSIEDLGVARDDPDALRRKIQQGLREDLLVLSGGVSVGDLDLVPSMLVELGVECIFHGVRIKPGKPVWAGKHPQGTWVFGLPGNPVSTFCCFHLFVRPALALLQRLAWREDMFRPFTLRDKFQGTNDRMTFWPAQICQGSSGEVRLLDWKGSSDLRTLADADVMIRLPVGETSLPAGSQVVGLSTGNFPN